MSNIFWPTEAQVALLEPFFPRATASFPSMIGECSAE